LDVFPVDAAGGGVLDTLRLSRATHPDTLIEHLGLDLSPVPGQRHRAAFDTYAAGLLLLCLSRAYPTWEALAGAAVPPGLPGARMPEAPPTLW
jgi:DNA polymerase-3 subunit epsilon/exodeoxyribonuclease X